MPVPVAASEAGRLARLAERIFPAYARRDRRARFVASAGLVTAVLGGAWAVAQPYRITFVDPYGQGGFWYLLAEPPLLVILVGLLFHAFVALPLVRDLERHDRERGQGGR